MPRRTRRPREESRDKVRWEEHLYGILTTLAYVVVVIAVGAIMTLLFAVFFKG